MKKVFTTICLFLIMGSAFAAPFKAILIITSCGIEWSYTPYPGQTADEVVEDALIIDEMLCGDW